jgi:hypothetical protein
VIFSDRAFFGELIARGRKELHFNENVDDILVDGVTSLGFERSIIRQMTSILSEDQ